MVNNYKQKGAVMGDEEALEKFVGEILADKDLSGMTDEAKVYLIDDLKTRLMDQINRALIDELSEEKLAEFNTMLDNDSITADQVQEFVASSGVDVKQVVARAALVFRDLYLQAPSQRDANNLQTNL